MAPPRMYLFPLFLLTFLIAAPLTGQGDAGKEFSPAEVAFFESKVRPVLHNSCVGCHSGEVQSSGLRLTSREAVLTGGKRGPAAIPGDAPNSVLVKALAHDGALKMPPTGKLEADEIAVLSRWVAMGLPWPKAPGAAASAGAKHWSFQPIERPAPPQVRDVAWVRNPIDNFVLARLEQEGIEPSPEAGRTTLIRRVTLDLIGLTPAMEELDAFVEDTRPDAYERLVDRLLASPHYGERWGRHWLDLARYADSNGYNIDAPREIWMYRDWVIRALNDGMPFDQFVIEQIAGDLLPNPSKQQIVATGFHRNTLLNLEGGIDFEQYRVDAVADRVDVTGAVFLGLTLGCARCHDHKYDPLSQRDFYRLYAFFNSIDELSGEFENEEGRKRAHEPVLEFGSPDEFTRRDASRAQVELLEKDLAAYEKTILSGEETWEASLTEEEIQKLGPRVAEVLAIPRGERNEFQQKAVTAKFNESDAGYSARRRGIQALRKQTPKLQSTMVMRELPKPRQAYIHLGGDFLRKGTEVEPGTPVVLPQLEGKESYNRLDLARWLVSAENPLTPRVTVNRIWQRYFGKGIVATENDFGSQGAAPTHPKLLDWMASEFISSGWGLKALHRLIVTSATYRQVSGARPELSGVDPENNLLARQVRLRLEAEIVRDAALSSSGLLTPTIGGKSVFPPQPAGAGRVTQIDRKWKADEDKNRYRRGMYTYFWRSAPHPGLIVFDGPDSMKTCTRRNRSNTPLQALTLLNDEAHIEFAQSFARRILKDAPPSNAERIEYAFRLSLARKPKPREAERLANFLASQLDDLRTRPKEAEAMIAGDLPEGTDAPELAAWSSVSRVLLNLDEFITRE